MNEADEVQQDDSIVQAEADTVISDAASTAEPDAVAEDIVGEGNQVEAEPDALTPGIKKRLNQLYARTKGAESENQQLREKTARLEGQLEATRAAPPVTEQKVEPRLTWTQLQAGIDDGKITLAQALDYRDETNQKALEAKFEQRLKEAQTTHSRGTTVQSEIAQYKSTVPGIVTVGSPERVKVEQEFAYLVNSMGYDQKDPRTELLACRNVFGDVKTAQARQTARTTIPERETMQDMPSNGKPKPDPKDPLKTITGEQRKHYQRMIDKGVYTGWGEVRDELKEYA